MTADLKKLIDEYNQSLYRLILAELAILVEYAGALKHDGEIYDRVVELQAYVKSKLVVKQ